LVKKSIEEVAKKIDRTPKAIRNMLRRNHLSVREIRCDLFSVESLASALHVRKAEVVFWIEQNWLEASVADQGKRRFYVITPEALKDLYKHHRGDLMKRGIRNQSLFEAYVEYCFAPKHTVGEQLLDVRRDKREREAFAALGGEDTDDEEEEEGDESDQDMDGISSRLRKWVAQTENLERGKHEICLHCGAPISSSRMSLREKFVTALSGNLLGFHAFDMFSHQSIKRPCICSTVG
jgi:RNA polymerase-binding transcription factor DksA